MAGASARRWWVALGALVLVAMALGLALVLRSDNDDEPAGSVRASLAAAAPARAPFEQLTETKVAVGDDCLCVVVADESSERVRGLRGVVDLGPYDGMLFVMDSQRAGRFTMADTLISLDIGFYSSDGSEVERLQMVPCPDDETECPTYGPDAAFLLALETPAGTLESGDLGSCS